MIKDHEASSDDRTDDHLGGKNRVHKRTLKSKIRRAKTEQDGNHGVNQLKLVVYLIPWEVNVIVEQIT